MQDVWVTIILPCYANLEPSGQQKSRRRRRRVCPLSEIFRSHRSLALPNLECGKVKKGDLAAV